MTKPFFPLFGWKPLGEATFFSQFLTRNKNNDYGPSAAFWLVNKHIWCLGLCKQVMACGPTARPSSHLLLQSQDDAGEQKLKDDPWAVLPEAIQRQGHSSAQLVPERKDQFHFSCGKKASYLQYITANVTRRSSLHGLYTPCKAVPRHEPHIINSWQTDTLQLNQLVAEIYYTDVSWLHIWAKEVSFQKTGCSWHKPGVGHTLLTWAKNPTVCFPKLSLSL